MRERGAAGKKECVLPLHVDRHGRGDSSLMLLHGFGASSFTWRHWIPALAESHQVWAVDLKGHGSAPAPRDERYSPHDHADLVHRLIVQEDIRRLTLFGHSMGGGIALLVALRLLGEERLERLVLVSSAAYAQRLPPFVALARHGRLARWVFAIIPKRPLIARVLRSIVYDPSAITRAQAEAYARPLRSSATRAALIRTALEIVPADMDQITARFPEIDVPTLLLWGRHDRVVPLSVGERLARSLPNARLEIVERCGHQLPEELPTDTLELVRAFLEGRDDCAPSAT